MSVQVKVQWTEQLVATQKQKTEQIKKETEKLNALADADRQKAVLQVDLEGARAESLNVPVSPSCDGAKFC